MKYARLLLAPLVVLAAFLLLGFLSTLVGIPPKEELIPIIKVYFETYGIALVFLSSILESAFVVGIYVPGGLVIFLGVIFAVGDPVHAVLVVAGVILGFLIGYSIDFFLGRYGWYKLFLHFGLAKGIEKTKLRIQKYGLSIPWLGYNDPNLGSLVATSYGILGFSYRKFLLVTVFPVVAWCAFWGCLAYALGMQALSLMGYKALLVVTGVWIVARIIEMKLEKRAEQKFVV